MDSTKTKPEDGKAASNGKKILVAEDEKPLSKALCLKLERLGFKAIPAYDGKEALKLIDAHSPDLIVLDLVMPLMDGFEVLQNLKTQGKTIPIIVVSNLGQTEDQTKVTALGAIKFFIKSSTPLVDLIDFIKEYLHV